MGNSTSRLMKRLVSKREIKFLMVGLDASGKTAILYKLKLGEVVRTLPTIGIIPVTLGLFQICIFLCKFLSQREFIFQSIHI